MNNQLLDIIIGVIDSVRLDNDGRYISCIQGKGIYFDTFQAAYDDAVERMNQITPEPFN
jgi:hypothetical protein